MSTRQPVRRAARRAFWPSLPMARESWKSGTMTVAVPVSSSIRTSLTLAGDRALATKSGGSSENGTMSIFSPRSSLTTMRTRAPRAPTQAPTGSTLWSFDQTAIFVRCPGSRAQARSSTMPSAISGTSSSNRPLDEPGVGAGHDDLRALRGLADLDDVGLDPGAGLGALVGHLLGLRQQRLDPAEVEQRVAAVVLLDDAGDDVALAAGVLLVLLLAVDLAEALGHDLLGRLGGDAAEVLGGDVDLVAVGLAVLVELLGEDPDLGGVGVDGDPGVLVGAAACACRPTRGRRPAPTAACRG